MITDLRMEKKPELIALWPHLEEREIIGSEIFESNLMNVDHDVFEEMKYFTLKI